MCEEERKDRQQEPRQEPAPRADGTDGEAAAAPAPAPPAEDLQARLRALEERLKRTEDALKRERADVINYRRRVERQMDGLRRAARAEFAAGLFPFLDAFFHAAQGLEKHRDFEGLKGAFQVLEKELHRLLEAWDLHPLGRPGEPFDPERHEAVLTRTARDVSGPVVDEVVRPGYLMAGQVLRTAQVVVKQPPQEAPAEEGEEQPRKEERDR